MTADLVARAQHGDTEAVGLIYEQYRGTVYWFILRRVRHTELAEDLTHDTFLRAMRAFSRPGGFVWQGKDLGAWLVTIARNLIHDHRKSHRYRRESVTDDILGYEATQRLREDPRDDPEAAVVDRHRDVALVHALAGLTDDQREAVLCRYLRDMSIAETAEALGRGESAVKALTYRAVQNIGKQFDGSWR